MKKVFALSIMLIFSFTLYALNIKEKIARIQGTALPFNCTKTAPWGKTIYNLSSSELGSLPLHTYKDLGLTERTTYETSARIFRKFQTNNRSYIVIALSIGESDPNKQLLATFNEEGTVIDFLEAGVYFITSERLYIKQWRIKEDSTVIITHLQLIDTVPIMFYSSFSSVQAQRVDTYYKIDSSGKFQEIKQVKYQPRTYTKTYLEDKTKNLWECNEVLIE